MDTPQLVMRLTSFFFTFCWNCTFKKKKLSYIYIACVVSRRIFVSITKSVRTG